jgi:hypothetical protein
MSIGAARFIPYEMKTSIIKIFSYEDKRITGVLINPYFKQDIYFDNIIRFCFSWKKCRIRSITLRKAWNAVRFCPGAPRSSLPENTARRN